MLPLGYRRCSCLLAEQAKVLDQRVINDSGRSAVHATAPRSTGPHTYLFALDPFLRENISKQKSGAPGFLETKVQVLDEAQRR